MPLAMFVLTFLIAIPSTFARRALLEGIALLAALRTHLRRGPMFLGVLVIFGLTLSFFTER